MENTVMEIVSERGTCAAADVDAAKPINEGAGGAVNGWTQTKTHILIAPSDTNVGFNPINRL